MREQCKNEHRGISHPKTDATVRTITPSLAATEQMRRYWERVDSRWIIPSPKRGCRGPAAVRKLLCRGLKQAQHPKIRFHNLRRTFVITTLEYGIGVKTLSAVVGHRSSSTTLNVYTYVTKVIERQTAAKIDQRIGKQRTPLEEAQETKHSTMTTFRADSGSAPGMSTATLRESVRRS